MKTLFLMLDEIYNELDKKMYDELSDYEKGLKDILNLLDCRISGNDEGEMFNNIMKDLKHNKIKLFTVKIKSTNNFDVLVNAKDFAEARKKALDLAKDEKQYSHWEVASAEMIGY